MVLNILVISALVFYFWAKQPTRPLKEYSKISRQHEHIIPPKSDSSIALVSYNIGYLSGMANNTPEQTNAQFYADNLLRVVNTLGEYAPDIIAFQEIDFGSSRSFGVQQLDAIAEALGFQYKAQVINWDVRYVPFPYFPVSSHFGLLVSGQGIVSRFPIEENERIVLQRVEGHPFYYDAFYLNRLAQVTQILLGEQPVTLINVHLEAFDKPTRLAQTHFVKDLYEQYAAKMPTILVGDFNSEWVSPDEPSIHALKGAKNIKMACPPEKVGSPEAYTFSSEAPYLQIDYIFFDSTRLEVTHWEVLHDIGSPSDHLPVLAKLQLKRRPQLP